MKKLFSEDLEARAKRNLVWKKNATYRNTFYSLGPLILLIYGISPGRGLLNTNPELGRLLLYALLPICIIVYLFMNDLYKSTISELTKDEIETEKTKIISSNALKKDRRASTLTLIIFFAILIIPALIYIYN